MKIKVGNYYINTDKWNTWITEEYTKEKGKHAGDKEVRMITGYCWTFEDALQTFRERTLGDSQATTLNELLEALRSVFEAMDAIDREAFEQGIKKLEEINGRKEL